MIDAYKIAFAVKLKQSMTRGLHVVSMLNGICIANLCDA